MRLTSREQKLLQIMKEKYFGMHCNRLAWASRLFNADLPIWPYRKEKLPEQIL